MSAVLDTHVLVWWVSRPDRLTKPIQTAIDRADGPLVVPDIVLWEVATLVSLGRLTLTMPVSEWLARATAKPLAQIQPITPAIAAEVAGLPDSFHRDPADRLIVSTARVLDLPLLTLDERIRASGLVRTTD